MTAPAGRTSPLALAERVHRFIDELRARGLPVSMTERVDAFQAVRGTALDNSHGLHTALAATVVKSRDHLAVFDEVFRLYFQTGVPAIAAGPADGDDSTDPGEATGPADGAEAVERPHALDLDHAVRTILRDGSEALARLVAEQAVTQFSGFEPGRRVAGILYETRALAGLKLAQVRAEMIGELSGGRPQVPHVDGLPLGTELAQQQINDRAEEIRQRVREVIREILVADRGVDAVAATLRSPLPSDIVISMASQAQLAEIEQVMGTLQVKLATTMMRKRRKRDGQLDLRATLRASMVTGGVPVRVHHRRPTPTKPKLYVLADVSGSVATFASFTITLVTAMADLFSQLRTFAFVENTVEVTDVIKVVRQPRDVIDAINVLPGLNFFDGHSNYGRSIRQFWEQAGPQLGRRTTVLVFGDARGNYQPAEEETFTHIARRAGAVYWLNPEGVGQWGTGDSVMPLYAAHCTAAVSMRTLRDLREFVERLD
jgi:uncharacterized protein with von Willebrand factor type A (vWA) domain